ncbi:MAG: PilZ domain-containing protein [Alphaproteobacteria bacterium]|nr:PilZ domain-containing protein [Alphaproteobacteria bacterium]MBV9372091.1 PilZ domain-containing protein [Alphaproteobacteria bacterium]MBV9901740.1 PilZ domain-containing protein [Alphaproteobacteria bacterium]
MRLSARLERSSVQDQRRHLRHSVHVGGGLGAPERPTSAITVVDLSTHGCGIELTSHVEAGARVWLKLPGLESWSARIVWEQDGRAGLAFDRSLHPSVVERYL